MKPRLISVLFTFCAAIVFASNAFAATSYYWDNGGVGSEWGTAGNWNPDGVPTSSDNNFISNGGTATVSQLALPRTIWLLVRKIAPPDILT